MLQQAYTLQQGSKPKKISMVMGIKFGFEICCLRALPQLCGNGVPHARVGVLLDRVVHVHVLFFLIFATRLCSLACNQSVTYSVTALGG